MLGTIISALIGGGGGFGGGQIISSLMGGGIGSPLIGVISGLVGGGAIVAYLARAALLQTPVLLLRAARLIPSKSLVDC